MNDETLERFLDESREYLRGLRRRVSSLDQFPAAETLAGMQVDVRAISTACGFLGLKPVWTAARQAETVLVGLENASPSVDRASLELLTDRFDALARELDGLETSASSDRDSTPGPVRWAVDDDFDSAIFDDDEPPHAQDSEPFDTVPRDDSLDPDDLAEQCESAPSPPLEMFEDQRRRVLVVDDSLFYRELVRVALEAEGFDVEVAADVDAARASFEHGVLPDVVVCELDLPGQSGFELGAMMMDRSRIPVVALSSRSVESGSADALAAGFDAFVTKYSTRELLKAIEVCPTETAMVEAAA